MRMSSVLVVALTGLAPAGAAAQGYHEPRWMVDGAFTALRVGGGRGWAWGPEASIQRNLSDRWAAMARVAAPVAGSDAGGIAIDAGPTIRSESGDEEIGLAVGPTVFALRESGFIQGRLGVFANFYWAGWYGNRLGLIAQTHLRVTFKGKSYPGFAIGAARRF